MSAASIPPLVPVDEYLSSSYGPDVEYVDGILSTRGLPTLPHSVLQMLLIQFFGQYQAALRFLPPPQVRTQIVERARYRIPDVMLCPLPLPAGKLITSIPWVIIEITSPDDKLTEILARFQDYEQIGVRHIIALDPEALVAFRFEDGSLIRTQFTSLDLPTGAVPFDTEGLFQQLTGELQKS